MTKKSNSRLQYKIAVSDSSRMCGSLITDARRVPMSVDLKLLETVRDAVQSNEFWQSYLTNFAFDYPPEVSTHLAVFLEPYPSYILDGQKTVESRFSVKRIPPYRRVGVGDVLLLKGTGGPIVGIGRISQVWSYHIDPESLCELQSVFSDALCAQDPEFWAERSNASFATLMRLDHVQSIAPVYVGKSDRRGWVVLRRRSRQMSLWNE